MAYTEEFEQYVISKLEEIPSDFNLARKCVPLFNLRQTIGAIRMKIQAIRMEEKFSIKGPIKRLFFDIETSYCIARVWRPGYKLNVGPHQIKEYAKIICISYKWQYSDKVHTVKWDGDQCDKALLLKFTQVMLKADEIVAHNGDRFDEKWIRTRCIFHRIPALPDYKSLDTLKKSKHHFNFPSNKLDEIGKYLGVGEKIKTDFQLWIDIIEKKCPKAMRKMVKYCEKDVILLEDIYTCIQSYIFPNTNFSVLKGGHKFHCPECGSMHVKHLKLATTPAGTFKRTMECVSCEKNYYINNKTYQDYLQYIMINCNK